jgi:hypothetical protein
MRSIILAALLIAPSVEARSVDMPSPRLEFVKETEIEVKCNGTSPLACTALRDITLQCDCVARSGKWAVDADAHAVPYIYTTSPRFIRHENLHVVDLYVSLEGYVRELNTTLFPSRTECLAYVHGLATQFPDAVRRFQRETTRRRDGHPID